MEIRLLGVTSEETVEYGKAAGVKSFGFDLRPKSFNFVQGHKIKSIIKRFPFEDYRLIFENEKEFMINGLYEDIKPSAHHLALEFNGATELNQLKNIKQEFCWHYHQEEKLKNIIQMPSLTSIVLHHNLLEVFQEKGELFGFLQLFLDFDEKIKFFLQLDWDTELIQSMFEYFNFEGLVFEISSKVEKSYQLVNHQLMVSQINYFKNIFA